MPRKNNDKFHYYRRGKVDELVEMICYVLKTEPEIVEGIMTYEQKYGVKYTEEAKRIFDHMFTFNQKYPI